MVTSPCRGLPPVITNFSNFIISLSQARQRQGHSGFLLDLSAHRWAHTLTIQLSYYTQLRAKSKAPFFPAGLFSVLPRICGDIRHFCFLFQKFYNQRPLPDAILAASLLDPAQLIGLDQLFQIVHPLPQSLPRPSLPPECGGSPFPVCSSATRCRCFRSRPFRH